MAFEWRPPNDPPEIPIEFVAHEDFVRELGFSGQVNSFPSGTTINLVIYPDSDVDSAAIATWPATVDLAAATGAWSVDFVAVDAIEMPAFYRLMLSMPNASDPSNSVLNRCLALGDMTRK